MQTYTWMPTPGLGRHAPQQTSCSMVPSPTAQEQYFSGQQRMSNQQTHGLWNSQSSSQPVSSLSNMQSRQMLQVWFNNSQNQLLQQNSASVRATLPNRQSTPLHAAQHGTPTQNLSCHPQTMSTYTVPQQNYNISPLHNVSNPTSVFWFSSGNSNGSSATEQNNLTHQSVPTQYQSLNGHHNQVLIAPQLQQLVLPNQALQAMHNNQGQITGGNGNGALPISANHLPTTSQRLVAPSQPSNHSFQTGRSHSSHNGNQVQHSSQIQHPPLQSRKENNSASYSHLKHGKKLQRLIQNGNPSLSTNQHFITQSQPIQNQSLSRDSVQPQTLLQPCNARQVSGHHSNATLSAIQGSTQPQDLQLNNTTTGLALSTQNRLSTSTLTSSAPPSSYITSIQNHFQLNLNNLLVGKDKTEVPVQSHGTRSLSCLRAMQEQTPSQMTTNTSYSQTPASALYSCTPPTLLSKENQRVSEDQTTGKKTALLKENQHALCDQNTEGMQSRKLQAVSSAERKDGHELKNQHGEAQNSKATELAKLVMALEKMLGQSAKAVAVVPPISQQASTLEKNAVTTSSDDCAIWTLDKESKNVEQESNAHSLPEKTTENLPPLVSATLHETQEQDKPQDSLHDAKCSDVPQSELGPTTSQDHTLETDKSSGSVSDLSNVRVFTVKVFKYWVKFLESIAEGTVKEPVANLIKYFIDLYWGGKIENLEKHIRISFAEITSLYSKISVEEMLMAQFQYFHPKDLKKLPHGYHILKSNTNIPTEEFRSSWLNIDERPADIEKVLAEPILDLMDYSLYSDFNPLQKNSESEPCTELNPATTVNQKDDRPTVNHKMGNEELANSHVCESKSTEEVSNMQEALKKQECEEYLEKPQQQDANMNPEESMDSNEMADTMTESKIKSECEQVCRDATEVNTTSETTEHKVFVQKNLCNDIDSSYDSELIEFSLLSSGDAAKIFKEYTDFDLQKEPSRLCHDGAKDSATPDNESNVFCSSAHQIKFTCPHMTDIVVDWDGEHFCPRCWEDTPLLDLDLEEAPLSPNKAGLESTSQKEGHHNQSYILQSGNSDLDCTELSEGSSITDSPASNVDVFEVTLSEPGPNPSDAVPSCTSPSGKLPVKDLHAPMFTESVRVTMPIEQVCETNGSVGPDIPTAWSCAQNRENLDVPKRVKTTRDEVCPPEIQPCKRLKLTKTIDIPAEYLNDISGDIVTKKVSSSKHNPSEMNETPAEDGQNSIDESLSPDKRAHRRLCSESVGVSMSTEQDCKAHKDMYVSVPKKLSLSKKPEKRKLVIPSETKTSKDKVCSPVSPLYKKIKVIKTTTRPAEDKLFTPDIVVKKVGAPKQSPSGLSVSLTQDTHHWKDEKARGDNQQSSTVLKGQLKQHSNRSTMDAYGNGKKSSVKSQVSRVTPQPKRPAIVTNFDMTKDMVLGKTKQTQPNNEVKRLKFALYGLSSGHQNKMVQHQCPGKKFSTAPVHLIISNRSETTNSYTDTPSAKQKVFSQWSSTFVETKKKTSHKKHQKTVKEKLKSKTQDSKDMLKTV